MGQDKLNVYKKNGLFIGVVSNSGDFTGLGDSVSYNSGDLYIQWETSDGKVSGKVPLGAFITGHPATLKIPAIIPSKLI